MYVNQEAGVIIPNPSQITWEGRVITSMELVFDREKSKVEPLESLIIKTKNSVFFKRTYHAPGIAFSEPEIEVPLFSKEIFYKDAPFMGKLSESVKEKITSAMRRLGTLAVRFDKASKSLEGVGEDWQASQEDDDETIANLKAIAIKSHQSIQNMLGNFNKKIVSEVEDEVSEWVSISEMRKLHVWDENVERAYSALFNDREIPDVVEREDEGIPMPDDSDLDEVKDWEEEAESNDTEEEVAEAFGAPSTVDEDSIA